MKNPRNATMKILRFSLILAICAVFLCACGAGGQAPSPSAPSVTQNGGSATPEQASSGGSAPGAVTDARATQQPTQTLSPYAEEAMQIRSKVEKLKGVEDCAVVVTDSNKAIVAVTLSQDASLTDDLKNEIVGAANKNTMVRVTSDPGMIGDVRALEEKMYETGSMPMNQAQSIFDAIS